MNPRTRLHRVILATSSLKRMTAFYGQVLELRSAGPPQGCGSPSASFLGPEAPYLMFVARPGMSSASPEFKPLGGIAFGVRRGTMDYWISKLAAARTRPTGRAWAFGDEYLCLSDPDGAELALVESDVDASRLIGVELHVRHDPDQVRLMAQFMGFMTVGVDGLTTRVQMEAGGVFLDLLDHPLSAAPTLRPYHQHHPLRATAPTPLRSHHVIVFGARDTASLEGIVDYAGQLGLRVTRNDDEMPPYILIDLRELCDFDFRVYVDSSESGDH